MKEQVTEENIVSRIDSEISEALGFDDEINYQNGQNEGNAAYLLIG